MKRLWPLALVLLSPTAAVAAGQPDLGCGARGGETSFTLKLPGFASPAKLLFPRGHATAVAVLVHGSDVEDLDGSVVVDKAVVSRPLRTLAEGLACRGIASVRYDKRFVTGPMEVDRAAFAKLKLQDFAADAEAAVVAVQGLPQVAGLPTFLVGWSEGTTVAADVAARRRGLAGLVLLAPVTPSFAAVLQRQWPATARPYVERYSRDGAIGAEGLAAAAAGPGGLVAKMYVGFLRGFAPGSRLNAAIDKNHDGAISLADEADPTFKDWFADTPDGGLGIYATAAALPGVAARMTEIAAPILVVQGLNDGNVDPQAARALAADYPTKVTLRLYPGLGHTLGLAASPQEDRFHDPAPAPVDEIAVWIRDRARRVRPGGIPALHHKRGA